MGADERIGMVCVSASFALSGESHSGCCCDGVLGRSGTSTRSTDFGCNAAALQMSIAERMSATRLMSSTKAGMLQPSRSSNACNAVLQCESYDALYAHFVCKMSSRAG